MKGSSKIHVELLDRLKKVDFLKGKKVALSGNFQIDRKSIEAKLTNDGANFQKSVDVDSGYLITGNNPLHGDIQAARASQVKLMTFEEYVKSTIQNAILRYRIRYHQ